MTEFIEETIFSSLSNVFSPVLFACDYTNLSLLILSFVILQMHLHMSINFTQKISKNFLWWNSRSMPMFVYIRTVNLIIAGRQPASALGANLCISFTPFPLFVCLLFKVLFFWLVAFVSIRITLHQHCLTMVSIPLSSISALH